MVSHIWTIVVVGFATIFVLLVLLSYLVETLRRAPGTPLQLKCHPPIPIRYVQLNGIELRYITIGAGPALVLLHTLRTQLDLFQKVIPELSQHFTVYALDYPGHGFSDIPKVEYWRFRWFQGFRTVMKGSVYHNGIIPPELLLEMHQVGNRPYHYRAFMSLVHHFPEWEKMRTEYGKIEIPVLLIYGEHDWSHPSERYANQDAISGAKITVVNDAGHLLSLDAPEEAIRLILGFGMRDIF